MRPLPLLACAVALIALAATGVDAGQGRRGARMRFRGMDRNGDGVITRAEWRGNDRSFDVHDRNRDGILSGDEVRAPEQAYFDRDGWDALVDQFDRTDSDNNGVISRDEWYGDRATFRRLDTDNNGVIRLSEFLGETLERDEAREDAVKEERQPVGTTSANRNVMKTAAYRAGFDRGLADGRQAGREDRERRNAWDLEGQRELEQADAGYQASMGRRDHYQTGYRAGFRQGYRQGFGPRETSILRQGYSRSILHLGPSRT
jgi:Ca2+-binding EF-hand superfamily protein